MIQLYFLSILCNALSGFILFTGTEEETEDKPQIPFFTPVFYLVLGIISGVTGILKLLSPMHGFPFLGDLVPAAAGIIAGVLLVFGIYRQDKSPESAPSGSLDVLGLSLLRYRKPLGLALLASALLHFIFRDAFLL
jgi:hypothetical protein